MARSSQRPEAWPNDDFKVRFSCAPTRLVVTEDEPRPAPEVETVAELSELV
jgi:hypothetical protein